MTAGWGEPSDIQRQLRQLSSGLSDVEDEVSSLTRQVSDVVDDVRQIRQEGETLTEQVEDHDSRLQDLTSQVKELTSRSSWLERHLRQSDDARTADLDDVDADTLQQAATADEGRTAQTRLLPSYERSRLQAIVGSHRAALREHDEAVERVLGACKVLSQTPIHSPEHAKARTAFQAGVNVIGRAGGTVESLRRTAAAARTALAADDKAQASEAETIQDGDRARRILMTRLRTRLAEAIGQALILPMWLTRPLGLTPPEHEAEDWLEAAAGIWAYRITYDVDHPLLPLGSLPDDAGTGRQQWHRQLERDIARQQA